MYFSNEHILVILLCAPSHNQALVDVGLWLGGGKPFQAFQSSIDVYTVVLPQSVGVIAREAHYLLVGSETELSC